MLELTDGLADCLEVAERVVDVGRHALGGANCARRSLPHNLHANIIETGIHICLLY